MHRIQRLSAPLTHTFSTLECVLRPALVDLSTPQEGFAISLYIKALGHDAAAAEEHWGSALSEAATLLRSRAFATS
jgi:hypothetical protein